MPLHQLGGTILLGKKSEIPHPMNNVIIITDHFQLFALAEREEKVEKKTGGKGYC